MQCIIIIWLRDYDICLTPCSPVCTRRVGPPLLASGIVGNIHTANSTISLQRLLRRQRLWLLLICPLSSDFPSPTSFLRVWLYAPGACTWYKSTCGHDRNAICAAVDGVSSLPGQSAHTKLDWLLPNKPSGSALGLEQPITSHGSSFQWSTALVSRALLGMPDRYLYICPFSR